MFELGRQAKQQGDIATARARWIRAAGHGNSDAMNELGRLAKRDGDVTAAITWYRRAADHGNSDAMFNLGLTSHQSGDRDSARMWFERAAHQGDTDAMRALGVFAMEDGDQTVTKSWLNRAADCGDATAMFALGQLAEADHELANAVNWYRRAANQGYPGAHRALNAAMVPSKTVEEWEDWIEQRLTAEPRYGWMISGTGLGAAQQLNADMAATNVLLVEILAQMTPRSSLSNFYSSIRGGASVDDPKLRIMSDVMWVIYDRDEGRASAARTSTGSPIDVAELRDATGLLFLFLHRLAVPNGFAALSRVAMKSDKQTSAEGVQRQVARAKLAIVLVDMLALAGSMPPLPAEALSVFR